MSVKSQENNMRRLAALLGQDLSYIFGEKESGPNGSKKTFLNVGKVFLRALAKDLGLSGCFLAVNGERAGAKFAMQRVGTTITGFSVNHRRSSRILEIFSLSLAGELGQSPPSSCQPTAPEQVWPPP